MLHQAIKFQGKAGDGVSFLGEFACVSEHKKDAPLPAVQKQNFTLQTLSQNSQIN